MAKEKIYEDLYYLNSEIESAKDSIKFHEAKKEEFINRYHQLESKIVDDMNAQQIHCIEKPIGRVPVTFLLEHDVTTSIVTVEDRKAAQKYDSKFGTKFINWVINGQGLKAWVSRQLVQRQPIPTFITYQEYAVIKIKLLQKEG